jgi:hypothetical protein
VPVGFCLSLGMGHSETVLARQDSVSVGVVSWDDVYIAWAMPHETYGMRSINAKEGAVLWI